MPRAPRQTAPVEQKNEYFILDPDATEIAGQRVKPGSETILLTEAEASFYLASGAISTTKPDSKDAVEMARQARAEPPPPAEPPAQPPAAQAELKSAPKGGKAPDTGASA